MFVIESFDAHGGDHTGMMYIEGGTWTMDIHEATQYSTQLVAQNVVNALDNQYNYVVLEI